MKKTTIWKLSALLLSFAMCAAFVGCAPDSGNDLDDTPSDGQTTDGDNTGDKTTEDVSPEELVSDIVTEEEWKAAFAPENFENVKAEITVTMSGTISTEAFTNEAFTYKQTQTTVICGNLLHLVQTTEGSESYLGQLREQYEMLGVSLNMDVYFDMEAKVMYQKNDQGAWETSTPSETILTLLDFRKAIQIALTPQEDMRYSEFHYDEESGSYCNSDQNLVWKFKDGKLTATIATLKSSTSTFSATQRTVSSYIYGGQSVTLPAVK